jgi:hypothetical protein
VKRLLIPALAAALLVPASAGATGGSTGTFRATVEDTAVVVTYSGAFGQTNFAFHVYNCPAGQIINITWEATEIQTDATVVGEASYIFSTGEPDQRLPLTAHGHFRGGYDWFGSGVVTCGPLTTTVTGSGKTALVGPGGGGDDDD